MSDLKLDIATADPEVLAATSLEPGERLVWAARTGHRRPGLGWLRLVVVGLIVAALGVWWMVAYSDAAGLRHLLFFVGGLFLLVGIAIATAPLWLGILGGPAVYALSDRRIFMVTGSRARLVRSALLDRIGALTVTEKPDGTGDILFGGVPGSAAGERHYQVNGLFGVPDARRVGGLITAEQARSTAEKQGAEAGPP
jgi:hypothetical protein